MSDVRQGTARKTKDPWRKREIVVGDDKQEIVIKLWDEHADIHIQVGDTIIVKNVVTRMFERQQSLSSTDFTSVTVRYAFVFQSYLRDLIWFDLVKSSDV